MILLKANSELKNIFSRMLKTMDANVVWTGNFVVLNNFLILSGNVRSMIFNFDKGKVLTNVIELPNKEEDMEPGGQPGIGKCAEHDGLCIWQMGSHPGP